MSFLDSNDSRPESAHYSDDDFESDMSTTPDNSRRSSRIEGKSDKSSMRPSVSAQSSRSGASQTSASAAVAAYCGTAAPPSPPSSRHSHASNHFAHSGHSHDNSRSDYASSKASSRRSSRHSAASALSSKHSHNSSSARGSVLKHSSASRGSSAAEVRGSHAASSAYSGTPASTRIDQVAPPEVASIAHAAKENRSTTSAASHDSSEGRRQSTSHHSSFARAISSRGKRSSSSSSSSASSSSLSGSRGEHGRSSSAENDDSTMEYRAQERMAPVAAKADEEQYDQGDTINDDDSSYDDAPTQGKQPHQFADSKPERGSPKHRGKKKAHEEEQPRPRVPQNQSELDDMLSENATLQNNIWELRRQHYRESLAGTLPKTETRKEVSVRLVQEAVLQDRLAQMLRTDNKELRAHSAQLAETIVRYKKASKYRGLVEAAKVEITTLAEEKRDLQLEVRCNEKLLLTHQNVIESGEGAHRLYEELRSRNALTERGLQHAIRDTDEAQRQRDGVQERVEALQRQIQQRRDNGAMDRYEVYEELKSTNREKRAMIQQLKRELARMRADTKSSPAQREGSKADAESEYLRERITYMRAELGRHSVVSSPNAAERQRPSSTGGMAEDFGYTTRPVRPESADNQHHHYSQLQQHENELAHMYHQRHEEQPPYPPKADETGAGGAVSWLDGDNDAYNFAANNNNYQSETATMGSELKSRLNGNTHTQAIREPNVSASATGVAAAGKHPSSSHTASEANAAPQQQDEATVYPTESAAPHSHAVTTNEVPDWLADDADAGLPATGVAPPSPRDHTDGAPSEQHWGGTATPHSQGRSQLGDKEAGHDADTGDMFDDHPDGHQHNGVETSHAQHQQPADSSPPTEGGIFDFNSDHEAATAPKDPIGTHEPWDTQHHIASTYNEEVIEEDVFSEEPLEDDEDSMFGDGGNVDISPSESAPVAKLAPAIAASNDDDEEPDWLRF